MLERISTRQGTRAHRATLPNTQASATMLARLARSSLARTFSSHARTFSSHSVQCAPAQPGPANHFTLAKTCTDQVKKYIAAKPSLKFLRLSVLGGEGEPMEDGTSTAGRLANVPAFVGHFRLSRTRVSFQDGLDHARRRRVRARACSRAVSPSPCLKVLTRKHTHAWFAPQVF